MRVVGLLRQAGMVFVFGLAVVLAVGCTPKAGDASKGGSSSGSSSKGASADEKLAAPASDDVTDVPDSGAKSN